MVPWRTIMRRVAEARSGISQRWEEDALLPSPSFLCPESGGLTSAARCALAHGRAALRPSSAAQAGVDTLGLAIWPPFDSTPTWQPMAEEGSRITRRGVKRLYLSGEGGRVLRGGGKAREGVEGGGGGGWRERSDRRSRLCFLWGKRQRSRGASRGAEAEGRAGHARATEPSSPAPCPAATRFARASSWLSTEMCIKMTSVSYVVPWRLCCRRAGIGRRAGGLAGQPLGSGAVAAARTGAASVCTASVGCAQTTRSGCPAQSDKIAAWGVHVNSHREGASSAGELRAPVAAAVLEQSGIDATFMQVPWSLGVAGRRRLENGGEGQIAAWIDRRTIEEEQCPNLRPRHGVETCLEPAPPVQAGTFGLRLGPPSARRHTLVYPRSACFSAVRVVLRIRSVMTSPRARIDMSRSS